MRAYDIFMAPLEFLWFNDYRRILLKEVQGKVLEIGMGTGANINHYNYDNIDKIIGIDLDIKIPLLKKMNEKTFVYKVNNEKIPFQDDSFDSVVFTFVLCSIEDVEAYLSEIKRVLKPNGKIYFLEHIKPNMKSEKLIDRFDICWNKVTKCHFNKKTDMHINKTFEKGMLVKVLKGIVCIGIFENNK